MAMCPILREECVGEQCAWWFEAESEEYSNCVIALLPDLLADAVDGLDDVKSEVKGVSSTIDSHYS